MAASTPRAERPASDPLSEDMQARLRYLQIEAVLHQTPLAMVANLACLRGQGCDGAQGYLISRPLAAEDVAGFIAGRAGALNAT